MPSNFLNNILMSLLLKLFFLMLGFFGLRPQHEKCCSKIVMGDLSTFGLRTQLENTIILDGDEKLSEAEQ